MNTKILTTIILLASLCLSAAAQTFSVKLNLVESGSGDPVAFATVSLTPDGGKKAVKYVLSDERGKASIEGVRPGSYSLKAELLGYKNHIRKIEVKEDVVLGTVKMSADREQLRAAQVSATGNPILIKKDTIEYNATSFKTTENDVLEDLLKKLPGVEVSEDGSITVNGETVKKITIDGKTFFLDDPQLASKNIPAKMVEKLKVIEKKSDQSEFTGIDDGEHETVIDLNIKPGMMKGTFGNIMLGGGHDVPSSAGKGDFRFQGAGFGGKFTKKQQISAVLNANNTNNRGFNDFSSSMMDNMRGGQGGRGRNQGGWGNSNGITTSYMAGLNGAWDLFDDKMDLGANYLFDHTQKDVKEQSLKTVFQKGDDDLVYKTGGLDGDYAISNTISNGHRFGIRLDHKFSDKTSLLFMPKVNFGNGSYVENSADTTFRKEIGGSIVNTAKTRNSGSNKNFSTDGFALLRQRLGAPGRTISLMVRYSFSNNDLTGLNYNEAIYKEGSKTDEIVDQRFDNNQKSLSVFTRLTYTEPLTQKLFLEANYGYSYSRSTSDKKTYENATGEQNFQYSNNVVNVGQNHDFGANLLYQTEKFRAQLGASAKPNTTLNTTTRYNSTTKAYEPMVFDSGTRWNWAPRAMLWAEFSESFSLRLFYFGRTVQPATSKLMPIEDNTDPLNKSFGNPSLLPYFNHSINSDIRYNNKKTFFSFNARISGEVIENPVVSTVWYNGGAQYSLPFNGSVPTTSANLHGFLNIPIAKSNFSLNYMSRLNWSSSSSYVGSNIDMSTYEKEGYYAFMNEFIQNFQNEKWYDEHITTNSTKSLSTVQRLRATYRSDALEVQVQGRSRINKSWYNLASQLSQTLTFSNQARLGVTWTWDAPGLSLKSQLNYNWYNGYDTAQPSEFVFDAEIQKLLFKKKVTLALKGYDILGQAKNLSVKDESNYHSEVLNNTLGRYIILSVTYRFGTFDKSKMRGPMGPGMGPGMGGGRRH